MISVLVADDHGIVREGLRRLVEAEADLQVTGEARDGREVLQQVEEQKPQVVVLDISMPRLGGLETLERLRTLHPDVKVILLSVHDDAPFIQSAISLGADGYVLKNGRASEIVTAIRAVTKGGSYFSPVVAREIVEQLRTPQVRSNEPFSVLSGREREVLHLIAEGMSAKEVAAGALDQHQDGRGPPHQPDAQARRPEGHRARALRVALRPDRALSQRSTDRERVASTSTCGVCGNRSKASTARSRYPSSRKRPRSRARVAGSHER